MAFNNHRLVVGTYVGLKEGQGLRTVGAKNMSVLNFTIAVSNRTKKGDEWVDGTSEFVNCVAWGQIAENIAESWEKGDKVIAYGDCGMKDGYTNKDGEEVAGRPELNVKVAGHDDSYYTSIQKREKKGGSNNSSGNSNSSSSTNTSKAAPKAKPENNNDELDLDALDMDSDMPF